MYICIYILASHSYYSEVSQGLAFGDVSVLSSVMKEIRTDDRSRAFLDRSAPGTCRAVITDPGTPHRLQLGNGDSCLCSCSNLMGDSSDTTVC